jgi:long-chain acyl-CoA synthetase
MSDYKTIPELLKYINSTFENQRVFNDKVDDKWISYSTKDIYEEVLKSYFSFKEIGVKRGDSVGIISDTNTQWMIIDLAIVCLGAISVPIFPNTSDNNFLYEIDDAAIKYIYLASPEKIEIIEKNINLFEKIIVRNLAASGDKIINHDDFIKLGSVHYQASTEQDIEDMIAQSNENDTITIIYTSGSTGIPKGVELTHKNLISQIKAIIEIIPLRKQCTALSFLPTAHIFERTIVYYYFASDQSVHFTHDLLQLGDLVKEVKPTIMTVVPRFLQKVYAKMVLNVKNAKGFKRVIAGLAFKRALEINIYHRRNIIDKVFDTLVYSKLRKALGGKIEMIVCGGAALSDKLYTFYRNIGIPLYTGYGLTETSPVVSTNYKKNNKIGTVGPPLPGVSVRLSPEGELLVKGDLVMKGYHNAPDETAKVIDEDGFLYTGDLAKIDDEGYITITGRKKELFKTSTGKYISPIPIEDIVSKLDLIDYAVIVAEARKFVTCLIFPDFEQWETHRDRRKHTATTAEEFYSSKQIVKEIRRHISKVNWKLHRWENIRKHKIIINRLTIDGNELTPKMSIRRDTIYDNYQNEINLMYGEMPGDI